MSIQIYLMLNLPEVWNNTGTKRECHSKGDDDDIVKNHTEHTVIQWSEVHENTDDQAHCTNNWNITSHLFWLSPHQSFLTVTFAIG